MNENIQKLGCVHGRFQPPHLEHLEYIEEALNRCETLIIGITQPNTESLDACGLDPHRAIPSENPLTYEQRCECIRAVLVAKGVSPSRFYFMKFRIDNPDELVKVLSKSVVCYTTIRNSWNINKINVLTSRGYIVEVLWDKQDEAAITGTEIRQRIRLKNPSWKDLVHPVVAESLEAMGAIAKIEAST